MERRQFLLAAAVAAADRRHGAVEQVFKSPGRHPNGLQATPNGLWIIDQADNRAYLVSYSDGKVLRALDTEADRASGITFDGEALWLASTYSRELIRTDPRTGKTLAKHFTPGAGVIYKLAGDPAARRSPLPLAHPPAPAQTAATQPAPQCHGALPGTGAHGLEWKDGKLWVAVPPSRTIYRIDPASWLVETKFPSSANRPHGIGWEGRWLWATDTNLNAFFRHDPDTGAVTQKIVLSDKDPLPHGMTIWQGILWYCDDVGVVCRFRLL